MLEERFPGEDSAAGVEQDESRRGFLKKAGTLSAGFATGYAASATVSRAAADDRAPKAEGSSSGRSRRQAQLPQIRLGQHWISRLVCGANPFNGGSHLSVFFNRRLREYYTPERILRTLRRCEEVGINCFQSGHKNLDLYRRYIDEGGQMYFLSIEAGDNAPLGQLKQAGCIGVAHHGEVTDRLLKSGQFDKIGDFLKRVHDAGMLAGISTHMPRAVYEAESRDWEIDYYMTCVYERHRSAEDLQKLLGHVPIPVGEVYLMSDPPRMFRAIQSTKRPCLAFKILAAGRLSDRRPWVEQAFRDTFAAIKPSDGVIVGMYDEYSDQPADNAALVRKYGALRQPDRASARG